MTYPKLMRAELRKLTSTRMPWAFLGVLALFAAINAALVVWGTDMDGSKAFISTAADQQSMIAFSMNALMLSGLFGAIAVAREYGHGTVVATFLAAPRRHRAVIAQVVAVMLGGVALGVVGAAMSTGAVALTLPTTDFGFLIAPASVARVLAAAAFAGAVGAVLGAGIGAVIRNTGGAVTGSVLALFIAPPMISQIARGASAWVPGELAAVVSGVGAELALPTAIAALAMWALVPAAAGLFSVKHRDVV